VQWIFTHRLDWEQVEIFIVRYQIEDILPSVNLEPDDEVLTSKVLKNLNYPMLSLNEQKL